jgi:lactate dehydrogenase-like 2-hydroxyacid dehydrogenase
MTIDILQTHKLLATCEAALARKYTVHKLHEAADQDALLASIRDKVRGIAGGNVQAELMDKLPRLEIVANFGVGYDTIDTKAAGRATSASPTRQMC